MIGLTATPAEFLDRNTFREFACDGNRPTYLYSYPQAVDDKYLVDFDLYSAKTRFQRKGIRGVDLTEEERNILIDQGLDPDALDYAGTEIERTVSNRTPCASSGRRSGSSASRIGRDSCRARPSSLP